MALGEALCRLAEQRSRIVSEPEPAPHTELIDELQTRASNLAVAVAKAEEKLEDNQQQRQESRAFKGVPHDLIRPPTHFAGQGKDFTWTRN